MAHRYTGSLPFLHCSEMGHVSQRIDMCRAHSPDCALIAAWKLKARNQDSPYAYKKVDMHVKIQINAMLTKFIIISYFWFPLWLSSQVKQKNRIDKGTWRFVIPAWGQGGIARYTYVQVLKELKSKEYITWLSIVSFIVSPTTIQAIV